MNTEQKARAYDKVREKIALRFGSNVAEEIFSEIEDSEDERIRKSLSAYFAKFKSNDMWDADFSFGDILAWLEKQGASIDVDSILNKVGINPAYKDGNAWCILYGDNIQDGVCGFGYTKEEALIEFLKDLLEKQGHTDGIIEKAKTEKQRVIITETNGNANIDWDTRSLEDAKKLLECGLQYINTELEKQGEQNTQGKSALEAIKEEKVDNRNYVKLADKVEPKFHEGEWIVWQNKCYKVNYNGCGYELIDQNGLRTSLEYGTVDESAHLWTIQDAKDGDVLVCEGKISKNKNGQEIGIVKKYVGRIGGCDTCFETYCFIAWEGDFRVGKHMGSPNIHPATKEQRDTLFAKMKEAGYTFDFDKKELKNIDNEEVNGEDYGIDGLWHAQRILEKTLGSVDGYQTDDGILEHQCAITAVKKLYEQKPTEWSKEDDVMVRDILRCMPTKSRPEYNQRRVDWIKSIKSRVQSQPKQEWKQENREELTEFENAMMHIGGSFFGENAGLDPNDTATIKEQAELLLELAPKTEWSEEDEKNLRRAIRTTKVVYPETADWLKSIRNRITLKPSIEQMKILEKVTEVDIEEEINHFWDSCIKHKNERGGNVIWSNKLEVEVLARHFYELGLKAQKGE